METKEKCCGRGHWRCNFWTCLGFGLLGIVGFSAFILVVGLVIMSLWNWLMPSLFHIVAITFWQAVGLAVLARLLFGVSHMGRHHWAHHRRWRHRHAHAGDCCCNDHHDGHHNGKEECNCNSDQWKYYDKFWEEEGEKSFNDFVKRKTETDK
jgi:hypothetical protein